MDATLRIEPTSARDPCRWAVGLLVSSGCTRLSATMVAARGQGLHLLPEVADGLIVQVPRETTLLWNQLVDSGRALSGADAIDALGELRGQLADLEASVVEAILEQAGVAPARVLVVGVQDPGIWTSSKAACVSCLGMCDPARLAEATGLNVIDDFPARDLSGGGQGGPLAALAEWVLLGHPQHGRLLVDLGQTTRLSYLGPARPECAEPRLWSFEVGPGMHLIDLLAQKLTNGEQPFDPGGRLAVQGQRLAPLLEHWLADPYFRRSIPRWHPRGVRPERFLLDGLQMAVEAGWSIRDLLCTATHFVAEAVSLAARRDLPQDAPVDQIVVTGGGQHNGMLLRELAILFPDTPLVRTTELGIESETLGPGCAAILTLLHLDQVPANPPEVTGSEVARVLGRLPPGSPQSWQRLLASLSGSRPTVRPLRAAM